MTVNATLVLTTGLLIGMGIYLLLERSLTRVLIGLVLIGNGVNLGFMVAAGPARNPPLLNRFEPGTITDPLPQALVLTAIVIALATTAFLLAMAYRSWQLVGNDDVQDDVEDAAVRRLAESDAASDSFDLSHSETTDDISEVYGEEGAEDSPGETLLDDEGLLDDEPPPDDEAEPDPATEPEPEPEPDPGPADRTTRGES